MRDTHAINEQTNKIVSVLNGYNKMHQDNGGYLAKWSPDFARQQHKIMSDLWYAADCMWEIRPPYPDERTLHYQMYHTITACINLANHHAVHSLPITTEEINTIFKMVEEDTLANQYKEDPVGYNVITGAYHNLYAKLFSVATSDLQASMLQYQIPMEVVNMEVKTSTGLAIMFASNIVAGFNLKLPSLNKSKYEQIDENWRTDPHFQHNYCRAHDAMFRQTTGDFRWANFDHVANTIDIKDPLVQRTANDIRDIVEDLQLVNGPYTTKWMYPAVLAILTSLEKDGMTAPKSAEAVAAKIAQDLEGCFADTKQIAMSVFWNDPLFRDISVKPIIQFVIEDLKMMMCRSLGGCHA